MLLNRLPEKSSTGKTSKYNSYVDQFFGNWIWRATHALIDHQDFNGSATWLSRRLGISVEEAVEALEGLEYLGLLQKSVDGFSSKEMTFNIAASDKETQVQMIKDHRLVTEQILNKMVSGNFQGYRIDFRASSKQLVSELCQDFWKQLDKFKLNSDLAAKKDGVFGVTFSAVQLFDEESNNAKEV